MEDSFDFPAAHSMDTAWFAVDRDGHVALFETGEAGAVPSEACLDEGHDWELRKEVDDATRRRLVDLGAERVEVSEGHGWVVRSAAANNAFFDDLHTRDLCLGCFLEPERDEDDVDVSEHGLYRYEHSTDNWISGPYAQVGKPETPVKIDELPADIATKAIVYDGSFRDAVPIQPAEIWQCESWQPNWLATDEKTVRPFPGRVDEMDEVIENLEGQEGLVVLREPLDDLPSGKLYDGKARPKAVDAPEPPPAPAAKKPWWRFW